MPSLFPSLDAAVYVDADTVFLRPPEHLWDEFLRFDHQQAVAMAPAGLYGSWVKVTGLCLMWELLRKAQYFKM